jgi:competence protein ComEC
MLPVALVSFVTGVCLLQLQAALPATYLIVLLGAAACIALLVLLIARPRQGVSTQAIVLAACMALGFAWAAGRSAERLADELAFADEGRDIRLEGVVASLPQHFERGVRFEFDVERVLTQGSHVPARVMLGWYARELDIRPGQRWEFTVRLRRPHGALNPGGFDLEAWMLERNLRASGYVRSPASSPRLVAPMVWRPGYAIERARAGLREQLRPMLSTQRYGGVLQALVLGDQRAIAAGDWTLFSRTGISHLVSISGLHITMIAGLAAFATAALWRRVPAAMVFAAAQSAGVMAGMLTALGYAMLAGWGVPAQRTVLMLTVVAVAWLARTRVGLGSALALAAAIVCLLDPWAVLAPGFWLSFGAVAAIVWVVMGRRQRSARPGWRGVLVAAARVQGAVTLALIPALIVLFHQLPLASPLANALAIPVVSWAVTPLALAGGLFATLPGPLAWLAQPLFMAAHGIFSLLAAALELIAAQPWATLPVATPPALLLALSAAGVAWLLAPPGWPLRSAGALALLPIFLWPAARPAAGELWVTALDVGQGSAVLIETTGQAWLYDSGPRHSSDTDAGERVILPYLRHRGIARLDGMIVSHLDADHSGGAASLLRGIEIGALLSSVPAGHAVFAGREDVQRCQAGELFASGPLTLEVLHPIADDYARRRSTNAMSCVVRISFGTVRILLTGDIGLREEAALVARTPDLAAVWIMAPHHGSRSSSGDLLLGAVGTQWALAQVGYRNRFGHPDPAVLERYRSHGVALARTDHHGALQWRFGTAGGVALTAWRDAGARYWHNRPAVEPLQPAAVEELEPPEVFPHLSEPFIAG